MYLFLHIFQLISPKTLQLINTSYYNCCSFKFTVKVMLLLFIFHFLYILIFNFFEGMKLQYFQKHYKVESNQSKNCESMNEYKSSTTKMQGLNALCRTYFISFQSLCTYNISYNYIYCKWQEVSLALIV